MNEKEIRAAIKAALQDEMQDFYHPEQTKVVWKIFAPIIRERDDLRAGSDLGRRMMDELYQELGEYRLAAEAEADLFDEARQYANEQRQRAETAETFRRMVEKEAGDLSEAVARVRERLDEWKATINSGAMHGTEWEQCLKANLPGMLAALDGTDGGRLLLNLEQRPDHSRDTHPLALDDTEDK